MLKQPETPCTVITFTEYFIIINGNRINIIFIAMPSPWPAPGIVTVVRTRSVGARLFSMCFTTYAIDQGVAVIFIMCPCSSTTIIQSFCRERAVFTPWTRGGRGCML